MGVKARARDCADVRRVVSSVVDKQTSWIANLDCEFFMRAGMKCRILKKENKGKEKKKRKKKEFVPVLVTWFSFLRYKKPACEIPSGFTSATLCVACGVVFARSSHRPIFVVPAENVREIRSKNSFHFRNSKGLFVFQTRTSMNNRNSLSTLIYSL